jgi:hypothetical protein
MLYQKGIVKNGQLVITESKEVNQSTLTSDCWPVQIEGLKACAECEVRRTEECGGESIRKNLKLMHIEQYTALLRRGEISEDFLRQVKSQIRKA